MEQTRMPDLSSNGIDDNHKAKAFKRKRLQPEKRFVFIRLPPFACLATHPSIQQLRRRQSQTIPSKLKQGQTSSNALASPHAYPHRSHSSHWSHESHIRRECLLAPFARPAFGITHHLSATFEFSSASFPVKTFPSGTNQPDHDSGYRRTLAAFRRR